MVIRVRSLRLAGIVAALLPVATMLSADGLTVIGSQQGAEPGRSVLVLVPEHDHPRTVTAARQIAALSIPKGSLEVASYPDAASLMASLDEADRRSDVLVVVRMDLEPAEKKSMKRLPEIAASLPGEVTPMATRAFAATFEEEMPAFTVAPLAGTEGRLEIRFAGEETARSRVDRWTRLLVTEVLAAEGMAPDAASVTASMRQGPLAYALYDCEGTGGSGASSLERIVNAMPQDATVTYLCPEDIRDGALAQFDGVLFPGGGGKSIANALGIEGQQAVRDFVAEGGGYTGICAGAFLATCRIEGYLQMAGAYHGQPWRKGGGMVDVELTPEGERIFGSEFRTFTTRYNNGPVFGHEEGHVPEGDFAPIETLAHFRSVPNNPDGKPSTEMMDKGAIHATTFGNGRVLMISPHPETHKEFDPMVGRGLLWTVKRHPAEQQAAAQ